MWKQFSLHSNYKWVNILRDIVDKYKNKIQSTNGMKIKNVQKKDEKLLQKLFLLT